MLAFPNGRHDDQIDSLSQYLGWVRQRTMSWQGEIGVEYSSLLTDPDSPWYNGGEPFGHRW